MPRIMNDEALDNILCAALEDEISCLCMKVEPIDESGDVTRYRGEYACEELRRGGRLRLYDRESNEIWTLDRQMFVAGASRYAQEHPKHTRPGKGGAVQLNDSDIDAVAADIS